MHCAIRRSFSGCVGAAALVWLLAAGCSSPDKANITLRKQAQDLTARMAALEKQHEVDVATIKSLQERNGTLPTLPYDRLARLVTTHELKIGHLTRSVDTDSTKPGDEELRVYAAPVDETGEPIKATGAFTIEAFDISREQNPRIGRWTFDLPAARAAWRNGFGLHTYVLNCLWQTPPVGSRLHVEVIFLDELTQTPFRKSVDVDVNPPPPAGPATAAKP